MLNRHPFINTLSNWAKMQSRERPTSHVVTIKERADPSLITKSLSAHYCPVITVPVPDYWTSIDRKQPPQLRPPTTRLLQPPVRPSVRLSGRPLVRLNVQRWTGCQDRWARQSKLNSRLYRRLAVRRQQDHITEKWRVWSHLPLSSRYLIQHSTPAVHLNLLLLTAHQLRCEQAAQLSQRDRAAGWVSFGWVVGDGASQTILCTKRCRCQKTKRIDVLHDISTFIRKTATLRF